MSESLAELERDVADARARLDQTIDAIQGRLTVTGIVDEVMGSVGNRQAAAGLDGVLGLLRRNPLPLMIVAAGVGWFIHRMSRDRLALRVSGPMLDDEPDLPLLNAGHSRIYDPDASTRHPGQDSLESRRDLTAHA